MQKKFLQKGALFVASTLFSFGAANSVSAATISEPSPWNNTTLQQELGFTCASNPTIAELGTSFETSAYMMGATASSVTFALIPAMDTNCNYLLPGVAGVTGVDYTLEYIELKVFSDYQALDSEALGVYQIQPDTNMRITLNGLDAGEDYYVRYTPKFKNVNDATYYNKSADTATLHTLFPMGKKYYNIDMKKNGEIVMSMKSTNPAYKNRKNAKVRLLLLTSKDKDKNVGAPVVKYLSSETSFLYYAFESVFAPNKKKEKKNYLVYTVSPKKFLTILNGGKLHTSTDLEELSTNWNVYNFVVSKKGKVKDFSSNKKLEPKGVCTITACKLK